MAGSLSIAELDRLITEAIEARPDLDDDDIAVGVMRPNSDRLEKLVEHLVVNEVRRIRGGEPEPGLLTVAEVAGLCRVSEMTVTRWVADKRLPAVRLPGMRGWYRFRRSDVDALLAVS